jgi:multiple sugar transport system permease protein
LWLLLVLFVLPRIVPPMVVVIPFSMMMHWLGLTDTLLALIIAHTTLALPLTVLILYSVLTELPSELLDAAQVDGCNPFEVLRLIVVPLLLPAMLAAGVLCFAQSWNEFLFALMNGQKWSWTAPQAVASLITKDGIEFEYVGTHLLLVMLPPPLLALLARRYLVRGLSLGTVKDEAPRARPTAP